METQEHCLANTYLLSAILKRENKALKSPMSYTYLYMVATVPLLTFAAVQQYRTTNSK